MGVEEPSRWYVVRTKPRAEAFAAANLRSKRIEVFLPHLARHFTAPVGDVSRALEPLFPGYLFARLSLSRQYHAAAWTPGVARFLSLGESLPTPVDDGVVETLRERAGSDQIVRPRPLMRRGDPVEIRKGPFAGLLAIIDRPCSGAGRIQILLDLLRRQTRLELPASAVVPV